MILYIEMVQKYPALDELNSPPLVVLGAGNSISGPSSSTIHNAWTAVNALRTKDVSSDILFALGYGSDKNAQYRISEAQAIENIVRQHAPFPIHIERDDASTDTISSMSNLAEMLERYPLINELCFIAPRGHIERALTIGKKVLGSHFTLTGLTTVEKIHDLDLIKEAALRGMYTAITARASDRDKLAQAHNTYRRIVATPKVVYTKVTRTNRY